QTASLKNDGPTHELRTAVWLILINFLPVIHWTLPVTFRYSPVRTRQLLCFAACSLNFYFARYRMTKKLGWSGRNSVKDAMREGSCAVAGSAWDSTPDFAAADTAAERLCQLPFWQSASVIRLNPDAPHIPV